MSELDVWRHCPVCASALGHEDGKVECAACGYVHYANPKPTASALVLDDQGRIMFSRRANDPAAGKLDLPGGFVEEGEHPLDCLHRELREEAGIGLRDTEFIGVFMDWYGVESGDVSTLNLYWSARIADGEPTADDDVEELVFVSPDEIPWDELAFRHLPDVISTWRRDEHA